jgi:murein L,D-transpeptidase YcbB/YkuD
MFKQAQVKRSNVTVDDRRAVLVIAQARKPKEVAEVSHENFIRNALKDRLGWPRREQAPDAVKDAAKHMAGALKKRDQEIFLKHKAAAELQAKKEAEAKAKQEADEKRWAEMGLKEHLDTLDPSAQALVEALAV